MRSACSAALAAALLLATAAAASAQDGTANPSFTLANRGNQPILELYATATGVANWGPDRMARYSLPPGMTMPIRLPGDGPCIYDIRVVYADGPPEEKRHLNTCVVDSIAFPGARTAATGQGGAPGNASGYGPGYGDQGGTQRGGQQAAGDPSFRLVNRGRSEVRAVYASPSGDDDWGRDRLGDDTVPPGRTYVIDLPKGQCSYDVLVVFANQQKVERRRVNLCIVMDFRVP